MVTLIAFLSQSRKSICEVDLLDSTPFNLVYAARDDRGTYVSGQGKRKGKRKRKEERKEIGRKNANLAPPSLFVGER